MVREIRWRETQAFFIRKYNAAKIVLEDEYQELINMKNKNQAEDEQEIDLVERVDNLRRT